METERTPLIVLDFVFLFFLFGFRIMLKRWTQFSNTSWLHFVVAKYNNQIAYDLSRFVCAKSIKFHENEFNKS